jgi:hypothetical protein
MIFKLAIEITTGSVTSSRSHKGHRHGDVGDRDSTTYTRRQIMTSLTRHIVMAGNIPTRLTKLVTLGAFRVNENTLSEAIPTTLGAWGANVR